MQSNVDQQPLVNNNQSSINNWPSLVKYLPRVPPVFGSHFLHLPSKTLNKDTSSSPNTQNEYYKGNNNLTHFDNESNRINVNTSISKLNSTSSQHFMSPSNYHRSHLFDTHDTTGGSIDPDLMSLVTSSPIDSPSSILDSNSLLSTPIAPSTSIPSEIEDWIKLTDHELSQIMADGPPVPPSPPSELVDSLNLNQGNDFPDSLLNGQLQNEQPPGYSYPTDGSGHSRPSTGDKFSRNSYVDGHVQRSIAPSRYGGYHNNRRPPPNYNSRYKPPPSIPYQPPPHRSQFNKNSHTNRINVNSGRGTLTPVYKSNPSKPTLAGGPVRPGNRRLDPESRYKNANYPPHNVNTRFRNRGNGNNNPSSNDGNSDERSGRGRFFGMPNVPGRQPKKKPGPSNTYYPEGGRFNWNHVDTTTAAPKLTTSKVSFDDHRYDFGYGGHKDTGRDIGQTAYDGGRRRKGKKNKKFKPSYSDNPINQDGQGFGFPVNDSSAAAATTTEKPTFVTTTKTTTRPTSESTTVTPPIVTTTTSNPATTSKTTISMTTTTTVAPQSVTTKKVANELKQALDEINELRGQLEVEESKLNEMKVEARKFSVKLKQMIKRTRRRQLFFYDTLLEKTLRYNEDIHVDRIKSQIASIREAKALLDSKVTRSTPWKARYVTKRIRGQNLVSGSEKLLSETKSRITELDKVLKDLAREKQL